MSDLEITDNMKPWDEAFPEMAAALRQITQDMAECEAQLQERLAVIRERALSYDKTDRLRREAIRRFQVEIGPIHKARNALIKNIATYESYRNSPRYLIKTWLTSPK